MREPTRRPALDLRGIAKRYGRRAALEDLTLTVEPGEIFGFLGPNGAGKTTAIKIVLGLVRPSAGTGLLLAAPLGNRTARRRVGYLPELFRYQHWLSARDVLVLHARLLQLEAPGAEIERLLDRVGLRERAHEPSGTYSKGMQQRLGLAVALLGSPRIVFLDEPTSALDPVGRHDVREILRDVRTAGTAVFLNSHLLSEVELVCDRIAIVNAGRVVRAGTVASLIGDTHAVRVRLQQYTPEAVAALAPFGSWTTSDEWTTVTGIEPARIPDLVSALVRAGARVEAVEPLHATLEDRFLELLQRA